MSKQTEQIKNKKKINENNRGRKCYRVANMGFVLVVSDGCAVCVCVCCVGVECAFICLYSACVRVRVGVSIVPFLL